MKLKFCTDGFLSTSVEKCMAHRKVKVRYLFDALVLGKTQK